ncbi:major facilitator superfamily domain-containing protein 4A isoform X2 [Sarcophilus harrisii]|uniref:major facilitator superfamily domain-containing protein 4A isoform X2 n=1 Tax=Sarcophilus harrisii TaxID=9305 RepID=UPI001301C2B3|nr:major facilitator superfamily domain-containing protein 4A isoform X2 [Sarcophilus harrisii]
MGCHGHISGLFRRNLQPTLTYWSVFFSFGLCIGFLGPTVSDLRCQTHSSLPQISWVFFSQQFCLLLGSALGGIFKKTLAKSLCVLFTSSLTISLVFAVIPLCQDVKVLATVIAVAGLAMGFIDTVANMQLVKIYQKDSAVFLQVLHFFVGFGALLSPLIADPFLSETDCLPINATNHDRGGSPHFRKILTPHHVLPNLTHHELPTHSWVGSQMSYAFWIMALINLPVPISVLFLLSKERMVPCCPKKKPLLLTTDELALQMELPEKEDSSSLSTKAQSETGHGNLFLCCQKKSFRGVPFSFFAIHITAALVLFMTDGIMGEYSAFVYTYAVDDPLFIGHKVAGYLPSIFWGFVTLGRLISIPISSRMSPATMVFINLRDLLVRGDRLPGPVPQQHLPQHAGVHRGHPAVQGLCNHDAGNRGRNRRDDTSAAHWLDYPSAGQIQLPGLWRDLWLPGFYLLHHAPVFPQDILQALISLDLGQTTRDRKP